MRQGIRYFLSISVAASFLTGCDLASLGALVDPTEEADPFEAPEDNAKAPAARPSNGNAVKPPSGAAARPPATGTKTPTVPKSPTKGNIAVGEPNPATPLAEGAISGLYYRNYSYFGGYPTPRLNLVENHYYFTADGKFYDGIPAGGLENFDWVAASKAEPKKVGTYKVVGDELQFSMADGTNWKMRFEREPDGKNLKLDGYFASLRGPFTVDLLSGAYSGGATAYSNTDNSSLTSDHSLKLFPDGTFQGYNIGASHGETELASDSSTQGT
jgi:hypothetical protein